MTFFYKEFDSLSLEVEGSPLPKRDSIQPVKRKRGRPRKTDVPLMVKSEVKQKKPRRTKNTGGVVEDDVDIEEYCTVIKLTVS